MLVDAHFHADDLYGHDPEFPRRYREAGVVGLASVHDGAGLEASRRIMAGAGLYLISFGLHPQLPVMDEAGLLETLAASGQLAAIGECGFDFFGDVPQRVRTDENLRTQQMIFEYQLELAERYGLPLVLHLRRADDLLFGYARRLSRLPAAILHSWGAPANEALDFHARCPNAKFSFGGNILNGNKKARASAAALPARAILSETDAPFQPPREAPLPGARLLREYSTIEDLPMTLKELADLREIDPGQLQEQINTNFMEVFDHVL
ncbi:MAG: TatD family hydrolase [Clostridia bacterium]|jgi:TatD DNase family protein